MTSTTMMRMEKMARPMGRVRLSRSQVAALPPGPRWPALVQSVGLLRFRHTFLPAMRRRYGDTFTVRVLPKGRYLVVFTRPEHIKEIFAGDPEVLHAGKGNSILGPVMGEHSLLLTDSSEHKRARKMLTPAFNGAALRGYRALVEQIAKVEVASWPEREPFRALERMNVLTLEVILRVVFGVTEEERLARLRPLVNNTVNVSPGIFLGYNFALLRKLGPWRRAIANQQRLDDALYDLIADRRAESSVEDRQDVLSRMLQVRDEDTGAGLADEELRDQLVTLLLAGHETTATALSWALHEIGKDPTLEARARAAAGSGDDDFLEAVLKEALRLHPVIPMAVRHLMGPVTIGGVQVPRGANVAASILLSHASEENFPDNLTFRPERFLEGEVHPNTWIPFGGGVRRCLGAGFSMMEGVAVLREVLSAYDVRIPPGSSEEPKVRNITSVPRNGSRIVVTRRSS